MKMDPFCLNWTQWQSVGTRTFDCTHDLPAAANQPASATKSASPVDGNQPVVIDQSTTANKSASPMDESHLPLEH